MRLKTQAIRLLAFLGLIWGSSYFQRPPEIAVGKYHVNGTVASMVLRKNNYLTFDFITEQPFHAKLRLHSRASQGLVQPGDKLSITVQLQPPHGCANPGCFNIENWYLNQKIAATGQVLSISNHEKNSFTNANRLRQYIYQKYHAILSTSKMLGAIVALSIGNNHDISTDQWKVMRNTGTSHLFAISGLHVGLVAGIIYFLVQCTCRLCPGVLLYFPQQILCTAFSIIFSVFYSAMAGLSVSTQRAIIMLSLVALQIFLRRRSSHNQLFTLAIVLVLLVNPWQLYSAAFYLSFAAVGFLLYASRTGSESLWRKYTDAQWVCFIGLTPLCAWFFQQASIMSIIANVIAIPFVSFISVPSCLLSIVLIFISPSLASVVLHFTAISLSGLFDFLKFLSELPLASITWVIQSWWQLIFAVLASITLLTFRLKRWRYFGLIFLLPAIIVYHSYPKDGEFWLTTLDVDQGLATVVRTKNHTLVFDTGAKFSTTDMGLSVIIPWLRYQGIKKLDGLVVSHGDNDHIGGAHSLLNEYPANAIYTSVPEKLPKAHYCIAGQFWQWDGVEFIILGPIKYQQRKINDISCVLKVKGKFGSALLTGDIEQSAENALVNHYHSQLESDVIVVPHHGSKTSSSINFLNHVKPKYAIFSYGYLNRYHHPSESVVKRYQQHGAKILDTVSSGAITLKLGRIRVIKQFRCD